MPDAIKIREMRDSDAKAVQHIHYKAAHVLAKVSYPEEILDSWSPPDDARRIEELLQNPDGEIRLVAEIDGKIVGFGALVVSKNELRACYVSPIAARRGVGSALLSALEKIAAQADLDYLCLDSSLNAEKFYQHNGYISLERTKHRTRNGLEMDAVKMHKKLH